MPMGRRKAIVLTPEQQRFAEIHYGLLLKFMAIHHLGDDEYGLFAERYLRTVATYMERKSLHSRYAFSTILWQRFRAELGRERRRQQRRRAEIPMDDVPFQLGRADDYSTALLWNDMARCLSKRQIELVRLKALGYSTREIAEMRSSHSKDIKSELSTIKELLEESDTI